MDFISNKDKQNSEMLKAIGVSSIEELFAAIPPHLLVPPPAGDDGISEFEGIQQLERLAAKNTFPRLESYLGGGAYEHHVPALVQAICSKSEFLTSYTPYQAETSQGMLQAIFEFQSAVCALTGMDVSNASLYDGASSCAEALLMSMRLHKERTKVLVAGTLNPHYRAVVDQYLTSHRIDILTIPMTDEGTLDMAFIRGQTDSNTAAILVQSPNFLGIMEDVKGAAEAAKGVGAITIQCANPLSYGLYASAAENGAGIAVGDFQPLGLSLSYGGPYVGYIACKQELVRQMPGRIVGETVDSAGKRGFVLTLQAREQHIRREKATSNICTNQALAALAVLIATLWYGKEGVPKLALANYQRAAYLKDKLTAIKGIVPLSSAPFFNEFAVSFGKPPEQVQEHFRKHGIEPGLSLGSYNKKLEGYFLIAVTETKNQEQLDRFCEVARGLGEGA